MTLIFSFLGENRFALKCLLLTFNILLESKVLNFSQITYSSAKLITGLFITFIQTSGSGHLTAVTVESNDMSPEQAALKRVVLMILAHTVRNIGYRGKII